MIRSYDVIVLGLGGMGTAAAAMLARRGARVLGLEQHALGHDRGASHGETRLIRKAYFESPRYVPLLHRAYELWHELSARTGGEPLLHATGLALFSRAAGKGELFSRAMATAAAAGIAVEDLTAAEVRARWPGLAVPDDLACLFEPGAGVLEVDRCVAAYAAAARSDGAELRAGEAVTSWTAAPGEVTVTTSRDTYRAARLVVTAGPWAKAMLAELPLPVRVHRVWQLWFPAGAPMDRAAATPAFAFDLDGHFVYGFPRWSDATCKICEHAPGAEISPQEAAEDAPVVSPAVLATIRAYLPHVTPTLARAKRCLYAMTPDEHFLVDKHPAHGNVCFAAGFSGHGFKLASAIGEVLAELALDGAPSRDIDFLRLSRFA